MLCNSEELDSVRQDMDGQYVLPAPGVDLLRDGAGVLPTGGWVYWIRVGQCMEP